MNVDQECRNAGVRSELLIDRVVIKPEAKTFGVTLHLALEQFVTEPALGIECIELETALQCRELLHREGKIGGRLSI
jgi:hypothetical protein